jgi:predicted glutamine amidotransferase
MCRIAAYYGPPVRLSSILSEPSHGLEQQSRNAREMKGGSVAGDGWGVGWIPADDPEKPGMIIEPPADLGRREREDRVARDLLEFDRRPHPLRQP